MPRTGVRPLVATLLFLLGLGVLLVTAPSAVADRTLGDDGVTSPATEEPTPTPRSTPEGDSSAPDDRQARRTPTPDGSDAASGDEDRRDGDGSTERPTPDATGPPVGSLPGEAGIPMAADSAVEHGSWHPPSAASNSITLPSLPLLQGLLDGSPLGSGACDCENPRFATLYRGPVVDMSEGPTQEAWTVEPRATAAARYGPPPEPNHSAETRPTAAVGTDGFATGSSTPPGTLPMAVVLVAGGAMVAAGRHGFVGGPSTRTLLRHQARRVGRACRVRVPRFLALLRYSRFDDSDPLENEVRASIYETVEASPGVSMASVAEQADVALPTVRYHARILESEGLVSVAELHGRRRLFGPYSDRKRLEAALADDGAAAVLQALNGQEPMSVSRLADELDRHPSTIGHHLERLLEDGLVEQTRDGRRKLTRLTPTARDGLATTAESAPDATGTEAESD